ncbi:anthocyanidin 3-O-glucoside 2''-O-glucosyltransferase-like [Chenopodium quinoa]|uniref:Glycosyltransferase n=1 Tax=Chenopodium quinoa TaxID=63459 RepID=A0A803LLQ0_CHEQI|nr:anthocyanidin 3-O-glucoside 2''-O-glucosyltransferase-like [Chenopodium quinoa]
MSKENGIANGNGNCKHLHIAMCPWYAFGHITSFLHLANKLAEKGHKISFFLPTNTKHRFTSHNHHPNLITLIPITVPAVDGLPVGAETTADVPASSRPLIMTAMDQTQDTIEFYLSSLKLDFIFFDFTEWVPKIARKHQVKSLFYSTVYLVTVAYLLPQPRNLPINSFSEEEMKKPPPGFPLPSVRLRAHEARSLAGASEAEFGGSGLSLLERVSIAFQQCDAVCIKTCREMEGPYCDFVQKNYRKPVLLAGPVVPELPAGQLDEYFDNWLKDFGNGSVVYCALGSECFLQKDQFQELVLGLELTGKPFLAALKLPTECSTLESALPEGFTERTKGRGIVHIDWVQQQLILQHPSVGCFLTHCGAGSLSEAIVCDCQLVMLPHAVDQSINARLMSLDLKLGVEIEKRDEDGFFTREAVCKAVATVMEVENEVGREVRANHAKWREFLLRDGLEEAYISGFIQSLKGILV